MANEEIEKTTLTINDGLRFGLGFMLVHLAGFAAIGLVALVIILVARAFGLSF